MISLESINVACGSFRLKEISLRIGTGEYAVLMGPTGCGKTTLLETICGLRAVQAGKILLDNRDVTQLHPAERQIGYVPQDLALFPTMTVQQHLEFALKLRNVTAAERLQRVQELAEWLGISQLLSRLPAGLSGGEAQRVALGRALSFRPSILLLDEPLSALDEITRHALQTLLKTVQRETGVTTLHVTHSPTEAALLGDRMFQWEHGQVVEIEKARDAQPSPNDQVREMNQFESDKDDTSAVTHQI